MVFFGFAVLCSLSALSSCVFSLLFLCPLSSLKEKSHFTLCSLMAIFFYKTAPFAVVKFWIANWSIIPCESSSSVSPVSSTSTHPPKLELQIICKHEKKLLETILATQRTDRDKISPPRHDSWGPRINIFDMWVMVWLYIIVPTNQKYIKYQQIKSIL